VIHEALERVESKGRQNDERVEDSYCCVGADL
jgi:hypothetical protein